MVGGFKHFLFSIIYGIILPIDKYFSEVETTTQIDIYIYGYESKYKVWIKAPDPHTIHTPRSIP